MNTATTSCFNHTLVEDFLLEDLLVYPNPTNSDITIEFESTSVSEIIIGVYNTLGQEIFNKKISSFSGQFKEKINLEYYSEGVYIVNIVSNTGQLYTKRISYIK